MSDPNKAEQAIPSREDVACETANNLLMDAFKSISVNTPQYLNNPTTAILVVGHALIAKLNSMETSNLEAMHDLRDNWDFLAGFLACDDEAGDEVREMLPSLKSERTFSLLKGIWLKRNPEHTPEERREAMLRFEKIAGL